MDNFDLKKYIAENREEFDPAKLARLEPLNVKNPDEFRELAIKYKDTINSIYAGRYAWNAYSSMLKNPSELREKLRELMSIVDQIEPLLK